MIAGASTAQHEALHGFSQALGVAFQVTDDVLNLCPDEGSYGKERYGDLWEGKRTSILLHALRTAPPHTRARALEALSRARPGSGERAPRTVEDVDFLVALINRTGSLDHARAQARHHALRADAWLAQLEATRPPSPHLAFLRSLLDYVHQRRQ